MAHFASKMIPSAVSSVGPTPPLLGSIGTRPTEEYVGDSLPDQPPTQSKATPLFSPLNGQKFQIASLNKLWPEHRVLKEPFSNVRQTNRNSATLVCSTSFFWLTPPHVVLKTSHLLGQPASPGATASPFTYFSWSRLLLAVFSTLVQKIRDVATPCAMPFMWEDV